jgi:hypothetical protein
MINKIKFCNAFIRFSQLSQSTSFVYKKLHNNLNEKNFFKINNLKGSVKKSEFIAL